MFMSWCGPWPSYAMAERISQDADRIMELEAENQSLHQTAVELQADIQRLTADLREATKAHLAAGEMLASAHKTRADAYDEIERLRSGAEPFPTNALRHSR